MEGKPAADRARVSLVLGSGGARGLAHIGVIEVLEEQGYEIRYIAGCSIGAMIGGIYAAGSLQAYKDWVTDLEARDVLNLLDFSFGWQGLFKGDRIIGVLREMVGEKNIEDLDMGFTAVATDLREQREIWFNSGPLFDAIRASIAIPSVLTPWEYQGRTLVDGGLLNPVPIAPALNQHADRIIAVNLNGRRGPTAPDDTVGASGLPGFLAVMTTSFATMQATITRLKLAAYTPDAVIEIPRDTCRFYEFNKAEQLIEIGRQQANAALARWQRPDEARP
ncbi:MAG: patatin-like phospholipase family protein [Gammaproteobacteria bacterium]